MSSEKIDFPRPSDGIRLTSFEWRAVRYRNVISVLKNPFYAGVYSYGKTTKQVKLVDGRAQVSYKHRRAMEDWDVFLKDHHDGYIDWAEYEGNQAQLTRNSFGKAGGAKSGRGGGALLAGLLSCRRCGRCLRVVYTGKYSRSVYRCDNPNLLLGKARCITFGGARVEEAVTAELLRALAPLAIAAAREAGNMEKQRHQERQRIAELELEQADYNATLAERRYGACDPENRLIAAQLEKNWEAALQRVQICRDVVEDLKVLENRPALPDFTGLGEDLRTTWQAPGTTMRTRQRLARCLIEDIVVELDSDAGEIVLIIHWKGGQHSSARVRKPKTGEHGCKTSEDALSVIRGMAGRWSDEHIAANLNRMGLPTGQGKTWNAKRVSSIRRVNDIHAYFSADKESEWWWCEKPNVGNGNCRG